MRQSPFEKATAALDELEKSEPRTPFCPYRANGHDNRREYLESLCESYDRDAVFALASVLGPDEDFDGLISGL